MKIGILTIFPEIFAGFIESSLINKAQQQGKLTISLTNIRDFADPPHYQVDDSPYGGGAGMVMRAEPIIKGVESMRSELPNAKVILLSPSGKRFDQRCAHKFSLESELILICGRYEGVDQRVSDMVVDEEISIGDFVLMGGEVAAMAVVEATSRLLENVLGNSASLVNESFEISSGEGPLLEGPQYTRPAEFRGVKVPDILFSGDHAKIAAWRLERARERTAKMRPDLRSK